MKILKLFFLISTLIFWATVTFAQNTEKEKTEPRPPKPPSIEIVTEEKEESTEIEFAEPSSISASDTSSFSDADTEPVFSVVEDMPEYPGGQEAMMRFINENIDYPQEDVKAKNEGRVIVSFVVSKTGETTQVKVVRKSDGVSLAMANSAIEVIESMPKWTPGRQRGKVVNVKYMLPVNFSLD